MVYLIRILIRELIMIMKNYVSDELANKVFQLSKILHQAEHIISVLEEENEELRKLLVLNKIDDNTVTHNEKTLCY